MFESCLRNNDAATDWFSVSLRFFMLLHGQQWNRFEKNDKRGETTDQPKFPVHLSKLGKELL